MTNSDEKTIAELSARRASVNAKLVDAQVPGFEAEFDPCEAQLAGAFIEDALSSQDAQDSAIDGVLASDPSGGTK